MKRRGVVYLVGAGPGDPGLLTCRGAELLARADTVIYDGLAPAAVLDRAPEDAERIYAGKKRGFGSPLSQSEICGLMIDRASRGRCVVRLKGGDPFVFGRGAEELATLASAGVAFEVVPGVTAATAVCAYAGIPLTDRDRASTVAFATGHRAAGQPAGPEDWAAIARADTVVLFMAVATAGECCDALIAGGRDAATPAAAIAWGTTASQKTVTAPLGELAEALAAAEIRPPALIVVGSVVEHAARFRWFERKPLSGQRILLTRSPQAGEHSRAVFAERGAEVQLAPVTTIAGPDDPEPLRRALARIEVFDWVGFASRNAVAHTFDELGALELDARALSGTKIACVGDATRRALADRGIRADVVAARSDATGLAEAIGAGGDLAGVRVLLPRAEKGRTEAAQQLEARGAEVTSVSAYRSVRATGAEPAVAWALDGLRAGRISACVFYAPSQVAALAELLGDDAAQVLGQCRCIAAIGATTSTALAEAGIRVDVTAPSPDAETVADGVQAWISATGPGGDLTRR